MNTKLDRNQTPDFVRGYRYQWEPAQNCHVLLYPEGMAKLNESAAMILQYVDGKRSLQQVIDELQSKFPDAPDLPADVEDFVRKAVENNWLQMKG